MMKIVLKHLNEIKEYQNLDFLEFREKLLEIIEEPDMATAYLGALAGVAQDREESIFEYMHHVRLLVLKAHPTLEHAARERILITSSCRTLRQATRGQPRGRQSTNSSRSGTVGC